MNDSARTQSVLFKGLAPKPLTVRFEEERTSSDGGAILLKAADERLGMISSMAASFTDRRDGSRVKHEIEELLSQRIFGIACGYEDGNDAARIAADPVMKTLAGRDPFGEDLGSQPSISRFERSATRRDLFRMGTSLMKAVVRAQRRGRKGWAKRITIDLDQTPLSTYGGQQLTFFNGHYDTYCYIPLVAAISFAGEPDQYVVAGILRPGNAPDKRGAISVLSRLLPLLREAFPQAALAVRFDAGFCAPEIIDYVESEGLDYAIAFPGNAVLDRASAILMSEVRFLASKTGVTEHRYAETTYQAGTWPRERRVIFKGGHANLRTRAKRQPEICRHQHARLGSAHLRERLLPARRLRESAQGVEERPRHGPHVVHLVPGQPVPRTHDHRGLRVVSGNPTVRHSTRARHRVPTPH